MTGAAFRVAAVPVGPAGANDLWAEVEAGVASAAAAGAALAVLPELTVLPYVAGDDPGRWRHLAGPADGPTPTRMRALARSHGIAVVFGMALADEACCLPVNAAMLAQSDGTLIRLVGKARLPPPAPGDAWGEADHFRPDPLPPRAARVGGIRVAALVCYDRRFAECWDRASVEADLVVVLVAGPAPLDPPGHFRAEMAGHARRCRVHAVAASRYGVEHGLGRPVRHDGDCLVLDPHGRVLAASPPDGSAPAVAAIIPSLQAA